MACRKIIIMSFVELLSGDHALPSGVSARISGNIRWHIPGSRARYNFYLGRPGKKS
jgi:hypothetical protein